MFAQKSILTTIFSLLALVLMVKAQNSSVTNCTLSKSKPSAQVGKYHLNTCIVAQFATYYTVTEGSYVELNNGIVNSNSSSCNSSLAKLVVDFPCGSLELHMGQTNDSRTYVMAINGQVAYNGNVTLFSNSTEMFYTSQPGRYYRCNSEQGVSMGSKGDLMVSQFAVEAFRNASGTDFYQVPEYCLLDSPPASDLVRIGVGVCLLALVVIVLIAYFIGRRRWIERSSYESV